MRVMNFTLGLLLLTSVFALTTASAGEYNPYADPDCDTTNEATWDASDCDANWDACSGNSGSYCTADNDHADCEEGQPPAGGEEFVALTFGALLVCEGEHWDGDDYAGGADGANGADTDASDGDVGVAVFDGPQGADEETTVTDPAGARVSAAKDSRGHAAYISLRIPIGGAAIMVDDHRDATRAGIYLEDYTPGNLLAFIVSIPDLTRGDPGEGDCSFTQYEKERAQPGGCTRDNTAITAEITP